ncbi:MAG: hypothetical protein KY453_07915 [Gemmatimonadetes bacterium]|nr:hypothetical protein [Gemmatimonadota bacterium]
MGGHVYVVGGVTRSGAAETSAGAFRYDPAGDRWDRLPDLPEGIAFPGLAVVGDTILALGGSARADGVSPRRSVWAWWEGEEAWRAHSALPILSMAPVAVATQGGVVAGRLGAAFTPSPGDSAAFLAAGSAEWRYIAPWPARGEALVSVGDEAWAVGAGRVTRYEAETDAWTDVSRVAAEGFLLAAAGGERRLHVMVRLGTIVDHQVLDAGSGTWTSAAAPPASSARHSAMVAVVDGRIYIIGGGEGPETILARVDVYTPPS